MLLLANLLLLKDAHYVCMHILCSVLNQAVNCDIKLILFSRRCRSCFFFSHFSSIVHNIASLQLNDSILYFIKSKIKFYSFIILYKFSFFCYHLFYFYEIICIFYITNITERDFCIFLTTIVLRKLYRNFI